MKRNFFDHFIINHQPHPNTQIEDEMKTKHRIKKDRIWNMDKKNLMKKKKHNAKYVKLYMILNLVDNLAKLSTVSIIH